MLLVLAHGVLLVLDSWEDFIFHMTVLVFKAVTGHFLTHCSVCVFVIISTGTIKYKTVFPPSD